MPSKTQVNGYVRVSTTMQEDGVSLDTQERKIRAWCELKGHEVKRIYTDSGISGATLDRPQLQRMLRDTLPGEIICVADISRMSRSHDDLAITMRELRDRNITFVCLYPEVDMSSPVGVALFQIMSVFSELERKMIGQRVKQNMLSISSQGKLRTRPPFGWRFVSKEEPFAEVPEQQAVIARILGMYADGKGKSATSIAAALNEDGLGYVLTLNKSGKPNKGFHAKTVLRILSDAGARKDTEGRKLLSDRFMHLDTT